MVNARGNRICHSRLELLDVWFCSRRRRRRRWRRRSTRRRRSGTRRSRSDRLSRLESRGSRRVSDPSRSGGNNSSAVRAGQSLSSGSPTTRGALQMRKRRECGYLFVVICHQWTHNGRLLRRLLGLGLARHRRGRDAVRRHARRNRYSRGLVDVAARDRVVFPERDRRHLALLLGVRDGRTDVDLHSAVGALLEVDEELGLEHAGDQGVAFLAARRVERHPVVLQVRQADAADRDQGDLAFERGLHVVVHCLRDEKVDGLVGLVSEPCQSGLTFYPQDPDLRLTRMRYRGLGFDDRPSRWTRSSALQLNRTDSLAELKGKHVSKEGRNLNKRRGKAHRQCRPRSGASSLRCCRVRRRRGSRP